MKTLHQVRFAAASQTDAAARAQMEEMARRLEAILALSALGDFAGTRRLPKACFDRYREAMAAYDRYIAHIIETEPLAVSCRAGCDACCRHELARGITPVEILAIYDAVHGWPDIEQVYGAAGESAVAFQRLLKAELAADPRPLAGEDDRVLKAHLAYNRLERPCAFLDLAQGTCRIYPVRPLVCRWFYNLSPPAWCEPSHPSYLAREAVGIDPYRRINDLLRSIGERLGLKTLNYLPGAFVHLAGDVLHGRPLRGRS